MNFFSFGSKTQEKEREREREKEKESKPSSPTLLPPPVYLRQVCVQLSEYELSAQHLLAETDVQFSEFELFLQYMSKSLLPQLSTLSFCPLQNTGEETLLSCSIPCCRVLNNKHIHALNAKDSFQHHHKLVLQLVHEEVEQCLKFLESKAQDFQNIPSAVSNHPAFSKYRPSASSSSSSSLHHLDTLTPQDLEAMKENVKKKLLHIQTEAAKFSGDPTYSMRLVVLDTQLKTYLETWSNLVDLRHEEYKKMNQMTIETIRSICAAWKEVILQTFIPEMKQVLLKQQEEEDKIHILFETQEKTRLQNEKTEFYKKISEWIVSQKEACKHIVGLLRALTQTSSKPFEPFSSSDPNKQVPSQDPSFQMAIPPAQQTFFLDSHSPFTVTSKARKDFEWKETPMYTAKIEFSVFDELKQSQEKQIGYLEESISIWSKKLLLSFKHPSMHMAMLKTGWSELLVWIQCAQKVFVSIAKEKVLETQAFEDSSSSSSSKDLETTLSFLTYKRDESKQSLKTLSTDIQAIQQLFQSVQQHVQQLNNQRESYIQQSSLTGSPFRLNMEQLFQIEHSIRQYNAKANVYNFELKKLKHHLAKEHDIQEKLNGTLRFLSEFQLAIKSQWETLIKNEDSMIRKWKHVQDTYHATYLQHRVKTNAFLQLKTGDIVVSLSELISQKIKEMIESRHKVMETLEKEFENVNEFLRKLSSSTDAIHAELTLALQSVSALLQTYQQDLDALVLYTDVVDVHQFEQSQKNVVLVFWACLCQITTEVFGSEEMKHLSLEFDRVCSDARKQGLGFPLGEETELNHPNQSSNVSSLMRFIYQSKINSTGDVYLTSVEKARRNDLYSMNMKTNKINEKLLKS